ncbi:MAG: hypothetical protein WAL90_11860 [Desulfobacterales bacterium]
MSEVEKQLARRCPRLGGPVAFLYCTSCEEEGRPCGKIIDCWWEVFDVRRYLEDTLEPAAFERLAGVRPVSKVGQLIGVIAQSKKRLADS